MAWLLRSWSLTSNWATICLYRTKLYCHNLLCFVLFFKSLDCFVIPFLVGQLGWMNVVDRVTSHSTIPTRAPNSWILWPWGNKLCMHIFNFIRKWKLLNFSWAFDKTGCWTSQCFCKRNYIDATDSESKRVIIPHVSVPKFLLNTNNCIFRENVHFIFVARGCHYWSILYKLQTMRERNKTFKHESYEILFYS